MIGSTPSDGLREVGEAPSPAPTASMRTPRKPTRLTRVDHLAVKLRSRSRITGDRDPCRGPCRVPDRGHRGGCRRSGPAPSAATAGNCEFHSPPSRKGGTVRGIPRGRPPVKIRGASVWFSLIASCLWFANADSSGCTVHAGGPRVRSANNLELRNDDACRVAVRLWRPPPEPRTGSPLAYTLERR